MIERALCWLAAALLLAGCATRPVAPVDDWQQHRKQIATLDQWQLNGRLAVRLPEDSATSSLRWSQFPQRYRLDLSGPFGQGRIRIHGRPGRITLEQAGEEPLHADSAEQLIWQATGWTLPVGDLAYWVRGIPAPDSEPDDWLHNERGLLAELHQSGWQLTYEDYQSHEGRRLPGHITAERGDVHLTLAIRSWQLPDIEDNQPE